MPEPVASSANNCFVDTPLRQREPASIPKADRRLYIRASLRGRTGGRIDKSRDATLDPPASSGCSNRVAICCVFGRNDDMEHFDVPGEDISRFVRLSRRIGAKIRIPMAAASWACNAALRG